MNRQIIIGFTTEGPTDVHFLESIIQRTFEDAAFECTGNVEVLPVQHIKNPGGDFVEMVEKCARQAEKNGIMVLCVHTDADSKTDENTFDSKINPAFTAIGDLNYRPLCNNLVAIVPVQMTEAWMLADRKLLKEEVGTSKSDIELGIDKPPEDYSNPKNIIENAIRKARQDLTRRRRRNLTISELYSPIGQKVALKSLEKLPSFQKFKKAVRGAFVKLNYLH